MLEAPAGIVIAPRCRYYLLILLSTNSAAFLLGQYLAWPENVRWACPSGRLLGLCAHFLSICPRAGSAFGLRLAEVAKSGALGWRSAG